MATRAGLRREALSNDLRLVYYPFLRRRGAQASSAAALACVPALVLFSTRPARRCRLSFANSPCLSFRPPTCRLPVRQRSAQCLIWGRLSLWPGTGRDSGSTWHSGMCRGGTRQTELATFFPPPLAQGPCQTVKPPSYASCLPSPPCSVTGTNVTERPRARLDGSATTRLLRLWGYRGCRVGEASNPGPEGPEPDRFVTIHRVPMGEEAPRPCTIRLFPQGGVWIWIVHSNPPLRVAGRKTPAEALQKWLQKFQDHQPGCFTGPA